MDPWITAVRYRADGRGHYESFYLKANDPERRRALWLKFNLLEPARRPEGLLGELWGVFWDDRSRRTLVLKSVAPRERVDARRGELRVRIGDAELDLSGEGLVERARVEDGGHTMSWDVRLTPTAPPLLLLPARWMYDRGFPKKKINTPIPRGVLEGELVVDGARLDVSGWRGFHGHNWGREHAHRYAYANAAFPDGCLLDGFSARIRLGPVLSPYLSVLVVRLPDGRELRFDEPRRWASGSPRVDDTWWSIDLPGRDGLSAFLTMACQPRDMAGLVYRYPDGRAGYCLNTKFARGRLVVREHGRLLHEAESDRCELETFGPRPPPGFVFHGD